jgi:hypothetical protein
MAAAAGARVAGAHRWRGVCSSNELPPSLIRHVCRPAALVRVCDLQGRGHQRHAGLVPRQTRSSSGLGCCTAPDQQLQHGSVSLNHLHAPLTATPIPPPPPPSETPQCPCLQMRSCACRRPSRTLSSVQAATRAHAAAAAVVPTHAALQPATNKLCAAAALLLRVCHSHTGARRPPAAAENTYTHTSKE